jgi:transposase
MQKLKPKAQDKLTELIKDVRNRKYKYVAVEEKPIDWRSYKEAQINEMNDYLVLVREIIDEIHRELGDIDQGRVGKPPKSCFDRAKAIMIQQYFEASNRIAEGLTRLFKEKLGIKDELTYKDIETAYESPYVVMVLKLLFEKTNEPVAGLEHEFSGDGTGLPTSIKQNYESDKTDSKKLRLYDKLVFIMGTKYKLLSAAEVTEGIANEAPFVVPLLAETAATHKDINLFCYDGAAYSYDIMDYITDVLHAEPRIMPPVDAVLKAYGCMSKKLMLLDFLHDTQQWLRRYHTRSNSESRNSSDKRVFPRPLLKRLDCRRYIEAYAEACRYNVRQLVYVFYVNHVPVKWLGSQNMAS